MPRSQNVLRLGQNRSLGPTGPTCGDDTYHATYKIPGPASFEVIIMVRGPAKAYELVSRYSRVSVNGPIKGSSQKIMV
ncbi:DUF6314 family protein [Sphingobium limneticum]|uniref:DUF6314 family protein n=1 Tax=Sphingobium limneticum TaxID=1007511 RepID=UPI003D082FD7